MCTELSSEPAVLRERAAQWTCPASTPHSDNNKLQRSCDTQMTVALRTKHLSSKHLFTGSSWFSSCSASSSTFPSIIPRSGYTSSNQALMPRVEPGQRLPGSWWNADTVSKLSGPLLNYSTPEEKKKKKHQVELKHDGIIAEVLDGKKLFSESRQAPDLSRPQFSKLNTT